MKIIDCPAPDPWDRYVTGHPHGGPFHFFGWKTIFERVYRLRTFYLMAVDDTRRPGIPEQPVATVSGVCGLALLRSPIARRRLVSLPYLDVGGILADDAEAENRLLQRALAIARGHHAGWIELRQQAPLHGLSAPAQVAAPSAVADHLQLRHQQVSSHKAILRRPLPADAEQLMQSFKSKLRSQIRKAIKNGLVPTVGGPERLADFYDVFSHNMRDLGSPVHARELFAAVFDAFGEAARIVLVHHGNKAVAAALVLRFGDRLHNPWASSLRAYRRLGANMLLYWTMLAHACDAGLGTFDFGRSSPGASTYRFKRQWGAEPTPLFWYYLTLRGKPVDPLAEHLCYPTWKRLPVGLTRLLGPMVRRHIGL